MKRLFALWLTAGLIVSACGLLGGSGSAPASPSGATSTLKVGVVTDIGQLEDKSFNEYSCRGVLDGTRAIGAPDPKVIVTKDIADYKQTATSRTTPPTAASARP